MRKGGRGEVSQGVFSSGELWLVEAVAVCFGMDGQARYGEFRRGGLGLVRCVRVRLGRDWLGGCG